MDQQASEPIEIVVGATYAADLTFPDLPATLTSLATAISFELRTDPADSSPFYAAALGGAITITGTATASLAIPAAATAAMPPGRCRYEVWLTLTTAERYRTDFGICNITGRP
jgi:hypothetical protein